MDNLELGPCCVCGGEGPQVRNTIMLDRLAPIPGRGWGCLQCRLPMNGAIAVVCDACLDQPLKYACRGFPRTDGRVPIEALRGEFKHDLTMHPEHLFQEN